MNRQQQMFSLIEEYHQSGLSAKRFCAEREIKYTTLIYWIGKKKKMKTCSTTTGDFIPIYPPPRHFGKEAMEIHYPNGVRINITRFSLEQIRSLIHLT